MSQSEEADQIWTALAAAQGAIKNAAFDAKNPHFGNRYATLASVADATREALSKNGISITDATDIREDGQEILVTTLGHKSGQWIRSSRRIPQGLKVQEYGAWLTYNRRYARISLLGISADEDDDGNIAQKANGRRENPHVNKAEDFVEDPQYDEDGNPIYIVPRSNKHLEPLRGADAKREYKNLQSEVIAIKTMPEFLSWVNLPSTIDRVHTLPDVQQGIFHNLCVSKKKELGLEKDNPQERRSEPANVATAD